MNLYEHTIVARQDTTQNQINQLKEKYTKIIEKFDGNIVKTEDWGLMQLSYIIKNNKKGNFIHFKLEGHGNMINELEKNGFLDIIDIDGDIMAWSQSNYPLEIEEGR